MTPKYVTIAELDAAIEEIDAADVENPEETAVIEALGEAFRKIRDSQHNIITTLVTMYETAAELNIDVSREAVYKLATQLLGPSESSENEL